MYCGGSCDEALQDALGVAIQLSLSMPLEEVMTFRKVAKAYFALIEVLAHQHMVRTPNERTD